jgi:hypothetical protein
VGQTLALHASACHHRHPSPPSQAGGTPTPACDRRAPIGFSCADVEAQLGAAGVKALLLLNPDLDCSQSIPPDAEVCLSQAGERTGMCRYLHTSS